jgi:hypothetical protein
MPFFLFNTAALSAGAAANGAIVVKLPRTARYHFKYFKRNAVVYPFAMEVSNPWNPHDSCMPFIGLSRQNHA